MTPLDQSITRLKDALAKFGRVRGQRPHKLVPLRAGDVRTVAKAVPDGPCKLCEDDHTEAHKDLQRCFVAHSQWKGCQDFSADQEVNLQADCVFHLLDRVESVPAVVSEG